MQEGRPVKIKEGAIKLEHAKTIAAARDPYGDEEGGKEPDWCERNPRKMTLLMVAFIILTVICALKGWVTV